MVPEYGFASGEMQRRVHKLNEEASSSMRRCSSSEIQQTRQMKQFPKVGNEKNQFSFQLAPVNQRLPWKLQPVTPKTAGVPQFRWTENSVSARIRLLSNSMLTLPLSRASRNFSRSLGGAALGSLFLLSGSTYGAGESQHLNVHSMATNSAKTGSDTNSQVQPEAIVGRSEIEHGATLAHVVCQSCHLFPEPNLLDKATWEREALPFMSKWLGISKMNLDLRPG